MLSCGMGQAIRRLLTERQRLSLTHSILSIFVSISRPLLLSVERCIVPGESNLVSCDT